MPALLTEIPEFAALPRPDVVSNGGYYLEWFSALELPGHGSLIIARDDDNDNTFNVQFEGVHESGYNAVAAAARARALYLDLLHAVREGTTYRVYIEGGPVRQRFDVLPSAPPRVVAAQQLLRAVQGNGRFKGRRITVTVKDPSGESATVAAEASY